MAVRRIRGARLRRAGRSRPIAVLIFFAGAAVVATAPAIGRFTSAFLAGGATGFGEPGAGDHLQTLYRFWLFGHQLEGGAAPWRDAYSFQPLVAEQVTLAGWPYGIPFWPLDALFGPVVAWNALQLTAITVAGLATYGWLRLLSLPTAACLAGGLAFAIAPYRLTQSLGHLLGWIAVFLPVALWAFERARVASTPHRANAWGLLSFVALVTIPLSGQVHLAIGALPLCLAYALVRRERRAGLWLGAACLAGVVAGAAIRLTVIAESSVSGGRSLDQVEQFQSSWRDLISRFRDGGIEEFAYVGWLTPVLAVVGVVLLWQRRRSLAWLLLVATVVPLVFALGTNTPIYGPIWRHFPPLHFTRVPGRLLPIAALALAALAAFAIAWLLGRVGPRPGRGGLAAGAAVLLVAADLLVLPYKATAADPGNAAYAALADRPGRVIELPLFEPGIHFGSIYHAYTIQTPRERPTGYSTLAPPRAYSFFWELNRLNCGIVRDGDVPLLRRLGIRSLLFHVGGYRQSGRASAWLAWEALQDVGLRATAHGGEIWLFPLELRPEAPRQPAPVLEPDRTQPIFCEGWRGFTMKERDAPLWVYTGAPVTLTLSAPRRVPVTLRLDGRERTLEIDGEQTIEIQVDGTGWHSIVPAVPRLFLELRPPRGLRLEKLQYVPDG